MIDFNKMFAQFSITDAPINYNAYNINAITTKYKPQMYTNADSNPPPEITCKKIQNYIFNFNDQIGQGNFSKVYKAHNEVTNEIVAIKIIELNSLKSKKLEELLFSEIQILKKLKHPNVLKCHEVFTSNRNCYIITELCNEGDLETKLRTKKAMKELEAETYIRDIFKGLVYLADNHIIHRDLKVANIFINDGEAKIADFGFAQLTKSKFKDINIGSPIYMSPEGLINNIYGPKTDVWAFGMLIFELLHGETPFSHCKSETELKYNMSIPIGWSQLKSQISNDLKEVILKCLEVDEGKRASAAELKKLPYFSRETSFGPNKLSIKESVFIGSNNELKLKTTLSNEEPGKFKSQNNLYKESIKTRIRTDNRVQSRKATRGMSELKDMPYFIKHQQPSSYLKIPDEEKDRRLSGGNQENRRLSSGNQETPNTSIRPYLKTFQLQTPHKSDAILSACITFKQCVNILHYCRLIFKHLIMMKDMNFGDQNQSNIFKRWLATILKTLMRQINQGKIACDGDNQTARQKKLEQVTSQYIKKYTKELNIDIPRMKLEESSIINYEKIYNYFLSVHQMIDQKIQKDGTNFKLQQLGHSIIMVCDSTRTMRKCYDEQNYKRIERFKELQQFLTLNKSTFNLSSYQWYKQKYLLNN